MQGILMNKHITVIPDVCNGCPVIINTRITVQTIIEFLRAGDSVKDILEEYPALTREDVYAAIQFSDKLHERNFTSSLLADKTNV